MLARALGVRALLPEVFESGSYQPLTITGSAAAHVLAFARQHAEQTVVVIVPLHVTPLLGRSSTPAFPPGAWRDTTVCLPSALSHVTLHSAFDRQTLHAPRLALGQVLAHLPVALLHT